MKYLFEVVYERERPIDPPNRREDGVVEHADITRIVEHYAAESFDEAWKIAHANQDMYTIIEAIIRKCPIINI